MKTATFFRPGIIAWIQLSEFMRYFFVAMSQSITYSEGVGLPVTYKGRRLFFIWWRIRYMAIARREVFSGKEVVVWRNPTCPEAVDHLMANVEQARRLAEMLKVHKKQAEEV